MRPCGSGAGATSSSFSFTQQLIGSREVLDVQSLSECLSFNLHVLPIFFFFQPSDSSKVHATSIMTTKTLNLASGFRFARCSESSVVCSDILFGNKHVTFI